MILCPFEYLMYPYYPAIRWAVIILLSVVITKPPQIEQFLLVNCNRKNNKNRPFNYVADFRRIVYILRRFPLLRPVEWHFLNIIENFIYFYSFFALSVFFGSLLHNKYVCLAKLSFSRQKKLSSKYAINKNLLSSKSKNTIYFSEF